jgi:hypothetical protein
MCFHLPVCNIEWGGKGDHFLSHFLPAKFLVSNYICNDWQGRKRTLYTVTCILLVKYMSHGKSPWELLLEEPWEMRESLLMKIFLELPFAIMPLTKPTILVPSSQIRYSCNVAMTCCPSLRILKPILQ